MNLTEIRRSERVALCSTLAEVGPAAPTLCSKWTASDLAGHLVVSERYWGLPMVVGYPLRRVLPTKVTERAMVTLQQVGEKQITGLTERGWDWLLSRLEAGPPTSYRLRSVAPIRLVEEWIHHEDVLRANDMGPRTPSSELNEALWQAGLILTRLPEFLPGRQGIEVKVPDGRSHSLGGTARVRVAGEPGEILLFLSGRTSAARVEVSGEEAAIHQLEHRLAV